MWSHNGGRSVNVGELQQKLSRWAEQDQERTFYGLLKLISQVEWLRLAHDHVARNRGSVTAGCDGITMKVFDENPERNLQALSVELRSGTFEPHPVRRVMLRVRKADGRIKQRPLGIPAIRDRIVQEAIRMALEPIFEADFSQDSFGFRPGRCTMDAIKRVYQVAHNNRKYFWCVEGDIASCFDTIGHRKLVKLLRRRIKDEKLIGLIWKFLRAGVMEGKLFRDTSEGVAQGGILSPLLANVYLHELDRHMEECYTSFTPTQRYRRRKKGLANFVYARYADDFVVMTNGTKAQAEALKEDLYGFLSKKLRLRLSKEKTKVTHVNDGFDFLGYRLVRKRSGRGERTMHLLIPAKAWRQIRHKINAATSPGTHRDSVATKITALNRLVRGWCTYYRFTSRATAEFRRLNHLLFWRMAHWLGRKYKRRMPAVMQRFRKGNTFATSTHALMLPTSIKTKRYLKPCKKPNPYTATDRLRLERETVFRLPNWTGAEWRPGRADLRWQVLERDGYRCQLSGRPVTPATAHVDHIKSRSCFSRPEQADCLENLQTLHMEVHQEKTQLERQMESRDARKRARPVRRGVSGDGA